MLRKVTLSLLAGLGSVAIGVSLAESTTDNRQRDTSYYGASVPIALRSVRVIGTNSNPELTRDIAKYIGIAPTTAKIVTFSDGECSIAVGETVREQDVFVIASTSSNDRLIELLLTVSALRRASARKITAVIPYYGYARQNKKTQGRKPISAADVSLMLCTMGVGRVIAVDLHSAQIQGFFPPSVPVDDLDACGVGAAFFHRHVLPPPQQPAATRDEQQQQQESEGTQPHVVIVAPHASSVHRAVKFRGQLEGMRGADSVGLAMVERILPSASSADAVLASIDGGDRTPVAEEEAGGSGELPLRQEVEVQAGEGARALLPRRSSAAHEAAVAALRRRVSGDSSVGGALHLIGHVEGCDVIVVDDIVDTGASLSQISRMLKGAGARRVYAFATHGRFTGDALDLLDKCPNLDLLAVTDTLELPAPWKAENPASFDPQLPANAERVQRVGEKVRRLSVAPLLGEAIVRSHTKQSLSSIL